MDGKEGRPVDPSWLACVDWKGWTISQLVFPGRLPNSCWGRKSFWNWFLGSKYRLAFGVLEAYKYTSLISYHLSGMVLTGWKTILSFWGAAYFQGRAVSFGRVSGKFLQVPKIIVRNWKIKVWKNPKCTLAYTFFLHHEQVNLFQPKIRLECDSFTLPHFPSSPPPAKKWWLGDQPSFWVPPHFHR